MPQAMFSHDQVANDTAGLAQEAGIDALLEGEACPLGEIVLVDCPEVDAALLAALTRLDLRAAHCGAQLVVSTSVEALEDVFACLDQSAPQILVAPSRGDRVIALGRALARCSATISDDDRLALLRLTEQVSEIA